jgi:hypothetical protein
MSTTTLWKRTLPRRSRTRSAARRIRSVTVVKKDTFRKPKQIFFNLDTSSQAGLPERRQSRQAACGGLPAALTRESTQAECCQRTLQPAIQRELRGAGVRSARLACACAPCAPGSRTESPPPRLSRLG